MAQRKIDSQPSALLMLSSEEMSCSLLGGLNDNNVIPTLLAVPQDINNSSLESASQLFLTDDGDVDNFIGQTSIFPTPVSSVPKSSATTISSFLQNPFSSPLLGNNHPLPAPPISANQASSISQLPPSVYQNNPSATDPVAGRDGAKNPYQNQRVGNYQQYAPPTTYYQPPPPQQSQFAYPPPPNQPPMQQTLPPPYTPPTYGQPPQDQTVLYGLHNLPGYTPNSAFYRPIESHWFYTKKVEGKTVWTPFSYGDSGRLEEYFSAGDQSNRLVGVEGGRYDVDIRGRVKKSVYWSEEDSEVRRCSWFFRSEGSSHFVPYDEKFAAGLEESYRHAVQTSDFHKRLAFPSGETIIIHSPSAIVHYPPTSQPDAWGNAMGDLRPQVVRRGVNEFENIPKDESDRVDHLVLIVLGFDYKAKKLLECANEFRQISEQMLNGHFSKSIREGQVGRVEFLPVAWSHDHLLDDVIGVEKIIKNLTLTSISKLRHFTNEVLIELMFYNSPSHAQKSVTLLTEALNRIHSAFKTRHRDFAGGVSIVGHGVGSVIVYDILSNQAEDFPDPKNINQSSCAGHQVTPIQNQGTTVPANPIQAGLKRSLNDSCSSLASLAESDKMSVLGPQSSLEEVLEKLGLRDYEEKFKSEQIDVASLVLLEDADIKEIGLPLGPRKKLQEFIKKNQSQINPCGDGLKSLQGAKQFTPESKNNFVEDENINVIRSTLETPSYTTFTFATKCHEEGQHGGMDVLLVKNCPLDFQLTNFFAIGSPVATVLALRGVNLLGEDFCLSTCPGYYNIFHPFDPLASRIEPLVLPNVPQTAVLIPHHKGRKRLHLELKENLARIGFDIKQKIIESFRSTWRTINNFAYGNKAADNEPKINDDEVDREVSSVLSEMQRDADDVSSVVASSVADESDFPVGSLNQGRRIDFVLQEKPLEIFNDYIFALASSTCYWQSEDTALMILKEIYLPMGIFSQKPGSSGYLLQSRGPIGPPPKSGFVQMSAVSKNQASMTQSLPYAPFSAQDTQSYQQSYWPTQNIRSMPTDPLPTNTISHPPAIQPSLSNMMPPQQTNQSFLPPQPSNYMMSTPISNKMLPTPANNMQSFPPSSQKFPPPANQMSAPMPGNHSPSAFYRPASHPPSAFYRPANQPYYPPPYGEGRQQGNYPIGPGSARPPLVGPPRMPLGPPPQSDYLRFN